MSVKQVTPMKCLEQITGLRKAITTGKIEPGAMVGTEFAFSQEWGLARNTVRKGIAQLVEEGLLERRPGKGLFVRLPHTPTKIVQLVVPNLAWSHMVKIVRGAQEEGRKCGVQIQVYDAHGQMDLDLEVIRQLPQGSSDGAIIASLHHRQFSEVLFELKSARYPFVLVDQRLHDLEVPTVEGDNYGGGYTVGKKLAEQGHRRVAFLAPLKLQISNDRLSGFRDAMLDSGVLFDRSLVIDLGGEGLTDWLNDKAAGSEQLVADVLSSPNPPTAIFDGSGDIAPYIYRAARQAGLRIPEDISIVTFDDSPFNVTLEPEVSRLRHCWTEMGESALQLLLLQMNKSTNGQSKLPEHKVLPVDWVSGSSLAAPGSAGSKET